MSEVGRRHLPHDSSGAPRRAHTDRFPNTSDLLPAPICWTIPKGTATVPIVTADSYSRADICVSCQSAFRQGAHICMQSRQVLCLHRVPDCHACASAKWFDRSLPRSPACVVPMVVMRMFCWELNPMPRHGGRAVPPQLGWDLTERLHHVCMCKELQSRPHAITSMNPPSPTTTPTSKMPRTAEAIP